MRNEDLSIGYEILARTELGIRESMAEAYEKVEWPEDYQRFLLSVWVDGISVAKVSGGDKTWWQWGERDPVSEEEKKLLFGWASFYDLDPLKAVEHLAE